MKKFTVFILFTILLVFLVTGEDQKSIVQTGETALGKVYFPRAFVQNGKDYNKGVYKVTLKEKEGEFYFNVFTTKDEPLFEEVAIVKKLKRKNAKFRIKKEILRGYEYFRIRVTKKDKMIFGYFLLKKKEIKKAKTEQAAVN